MREFNEFGNVDCYENLGNLIEVMVAKRYARIKGNEAELLQRLGFLSRQAAAKQGIKLHSLSTYFNEDNSGFIRGQNSKFKQACRDLDVKFRNLNGTMEFVLGPSHKISEEGRQAA